jgi:hypothetical protein
MSSSFRRIVSKLSAKLPRDEDRQLLAKLADCYESGGSDTVKEALEEMLESLESE